MDNSLEPAGKASIQTIDDTLDNLAPISARLKGRDQIEAARRTRP